MNTAVDIVIELKMSSKKDYTDRFDQKFDAVFDVIDLPNLSLFEIIENVKSLDFSVDPELIQIIIQKKLDYISSEPLCSCCGRRMHKKYTRKKEVKTTVGPMSFDCPYMVCPKCKTHHTPYSNSHFVPKRALLNGIEGFLGSIGGCVTHSCSAFSARRSQATCFWGPLGSFRAH